MHDLGGTTRRRSASTIATTSSDEGFRGIPPPAPFTPRPSSHSYSKRLEEGEFLQEPCEDEKIQPVLNDAPIRRYDWRSRAKSRMSKDHLVELPKDYKRRIRTPAGTSGGYSMSSAFEIYSEKFLRLLWMEEAEDKAEFTHRLATWGIDRLQKEGYCLTGMGGYWLKANQFGRPVANFSLGPGIVLPENKFETGSQVLISRLDPLKEVPYEGSVLSRSETQVRICFPSQFELDEGSWRMDLGRPNMIYDRMRTAIGQLEHNPLDVLKVVPTGSSELILEGTELRDVILQAFEPAKEGTAEETTSRTDNSQLLFDGAFKDNQLINSWAKRYSQPNPIVIDGDPPLEGLNSSQIKAMAMMIGQRMSLIQGPPGTGKTKTIVDTVRLLKVDFEVPHPLLLCTYTNVAVDNLVHGLARAGLKPLRIGSLGSIRESLVPYSLDFKIQQHPQTPIVQKLGEEANSVEEEITHLDSNYTTLIKKKHGLTLHRSRDDIMKRLINMKKALMRLKTREIFLKSKIFTFRQKILKDIISDADVVCTTCITSACYALNIMDFPVVFIDEASMSTEPATLIPLMKGSEHVSLIGDHKQLPPVIASHEAREGGFAVSLFERLIEENKVPTVMLDIQYRMHPDISRFPAKEFYNLSLMDGTVDASGNALPGLEPVMSMHTRHHPELSKPSVVFLDHANNESYKGRSLMNVMEAHIVASVVEDLLVSNPTLTGDDIGIIAPYVAQIQLLERYLGGTNPEYRARFEAVLGVERAREVQRVEIKTVDGFEGREKQVIIFSTVRNNARGHIGFLADKKRLNVGLTRAKRGLFVVGSITTLREGRMRMSQTDALPVPMEGADMDIYPDDAAMFAHEEMKAVGEAEAVVEAEVRAEEAAATAAAVKTKAKSKPRAKIPNGGESWRRYAEYLLGRNLVVPLSGEALTPVLYGHHEAARRREARRSIKG